MSRRVAQAYPFLFALVPVLNYAANNPGQFELGDLALLLGARAGGVRRWSTRSRRSRRAAAARCRAAAVRRAARGGLVLRLPPGRRGCCRATRRTPPHALLIVGRPGALASALVWWIRRRERLLDGLGRFLTLMGALLVGWSAIQIGAGLASRAPAPSPRARWPASWPGRSTGRRQRREPAARHLSDRARRVRQLRRAAGAVRLRQPAVRGQPPRARASTCPRLVRSNYVHTLLSLPSMLNSAHLDGAGAASWAREREHPGAAELPAGAQPGGPRTSRRGATATSSSPRSGGTRPAAAPLADVEFQRLERVRSHPGDAGRRAAADGARARACCATSTGTTAGRRTTSAGRSEGSPPCRASDRAGLRLRPHPEAARPVRLRPRVRDARARRREDDDVGPYIEQLECVNRLVLATVREILRALHGAARSSCSRATTAPSSSHATGYPTCGGGAAGRRPRAVRRVRGVLSARRRAARRSGTRSRS